MRDVYVISSCRTAVGKFGGSLKDVPAAELGATVIAEALKRGNVKGEWLDEVMFGNVLSAAQGQNVARQCMVKAGVPLKVPAYTVSMVCGSGLKSVIEGSRAIQAGDADLIMCGGTENMSAAPYAIPEARWGARMGEKKLIDTMIKDGLWDAYNNYHMGTTAENICDIWGITREELDEFGYNSQQKAVAAVKSGRFKDEIVPVTVKQKKKEFVFDTDEDPRDTTLEKLGSLKGAFAVSDDNTVDKVDMTFEATHMTPSADNIGVKRVTAGNASGINDAAAYMVLASEDYVKAHNLKPMAKIKSYGSVGCDPSIMGIGPIESTRQALKRAGLTVDDLDVIESNEAFAAQACAVNSTLGFDMDKVNVNGGAIALGHPIGAAGCRISTTLLYEMIKRDATYGLATMCIGGGMGEAIIVERDELCK